MLSKFVVNVKDFYKFNELLKQLVIRDVKLKYRRSYLGYLWSILNPLMLMLVLIVVFSNLFRFDIPNFPTYLITGQIIFGFMNEATNVAVSSIISNSSLINKVYVPKYIFTLSKVCSSLVNLIFSFGALIIVLVVTQTPISWNILFVPVVIFQVFLFSLGLSLFISALTVFFRDIQYLWGVFVSMWMYLTPLFYPISIISEEYQGLYKALNPMYWYIEQFREVILFDRLPETASVIYGVLYAALALVLGILYFNKKQNEFILYI